MGKPADRKSKKAIGHRKRSAKRAPAAAAAPKLSPAGAKIVGAFEEAIALMRTGEPLERHFTVRTYKVEFAPRDYGPDDVRRVRALMGMSQVLFARFLGVDANTIRSWEQGTRPPSPIARRFMDEIEGDPEYWRQRIIQNAIGVRTGPANP
jgi:DNA-binding transcriptional regulator YiaG